MIKLLKKCEHELVVAEMVGGEEGETNRVKSYEGISTNQYKSYEGAQAQVSNM